MKKIILSLCCAFMLVACFPSKSGLVHVDAQDATKAIENKETMILLVGKSDCGACATFKEVIDEFVKNYDIRITEVYIDDEKEEDENGNVIHPNYDKLEEHIGVVGGTPSVYFIEEGVIKGTFTGSITYESFKTKVEKYGFLPE